MKIKLQEVFPCSTARFQIYAILKRVNINLQKVGNRQGNYITLKQMENGIKAHEKLLKETGYSPKRETIRILKSYYKILKGWK